MIRISTVQLSVIPGNIRANFEQMEREIQNARKQNTDILIFPELWVHDRRPVGTECFPS